MINLAGFIQESIVDGPGMRSTIFVQGCKRHCPGCQNPKTWSFETKELVKTDDLYSRIIKDSIITGVTLSGGEPFEQSEELLDLVKKLSPKYNIMIYSGYTYEELIRDPIKSELLFETDFLVDGAFIEELKDLSLRFRGSSNQRIIDVKKSIVENEIILANI
jgi:anaerobic ribonucleoside-triphosphate reductase activating protein